MSSSHIETEDSDSEVLRPESLRLPSLTPQQMQKGLSDLRRMDKKQLENIAALMTTMDPRLIETIFKAQGINYGAEDIAKLTSILNSSTIDKIANITARPPRSTPRPSAPDMSHTIARRLQKDPEQVQTVLKCLYIAIVPFQIAFNVTRALLTGPRKFYFIPALVGAVCYLVTTTLQVH